MSVLVHEVRVQSHLDGLQFPVTTSVLVDHIRRSGAPDHVVEVLERTGERIFEDRLAVSEALEP
ncbi:DUF2795 domain-containing protein [Agromyces sp. H3Y2-19a]|uniref:DUF2795 domain-containing protein n=1 Tax=Agromyces TaxID=33877 RepID=UPI001E2CA3E1|nr:MULTISPECIES: DUF2795 domain-containing protein [Agromyces]MCD5344837.1 DUF2795 domain-containing protein [Agromyces sp. S2-1-8]MDF0513980.1 DUF2795 domain-containing protein [Agromyces chromiiresistens]